MIEFLTALLVLITGFYAWVTYKMLHANNTVVALMAEQTEAISRPYVTVAAFLPPEKLLFVLKIANTGKTAARHLKLTLDKEFNKYGRDGCNSKFSEFLAFKQEIESFPPGAELFFDLALGCNFFGEESEKELTPSVFTVTAEYCYGDRIVTEHNTIDIRPYYMTNLPEDPLVSQVKELREAIDKSGEKVKRAIEDGLKSGFTQTRP